MTSLLLTADRLFDGTGTACQQNPVLRITGERIEAINGAAPPDREQFAFPGCTVLPGLIDTHVHLIFSAAATNAAIIEQVGRESDEELLQRALTNCRAALHAGLTTVRDCGGKGRLIQEVRERLRHGEAEGPDVLACGAPITTTTGHCHWLGLIADSADEVVRAGERMLAEDADFLKIMATGGNMTPSSDPMRAQYDVEALIRLADLGRSAGKHTAAHVLSRAAMPQAVAARIRTVEHCDWRVQEWVYEFDPALARQLVEQEQYVGLTMSATARRALMPEIARDRYGPVLRLDARFECERRLIDSGVRYTLHSDAGVRLTPIETFAVGLRCAERELRLTPTEVLVAVTSTAAEAIGLRDRGVLAAGRRADVLVVEGNPLTDLSCLQRVRAVLKAGRWVMGPSSSSPRQ
jgi:imidazolonepropionase-like amidohydrolase